MKLECLAGIAGGAPSDKADVHLKRHRHQRLEVDTVVLYSMAPKR